MESCGFVYQNIDLFSLYTSAFALLLVHVFWFNSSCKGPRNGPSLSWHLPVKSFTSRASERWGSMSPGSAVPWLAVTAFVLRENIYLIGPFQNNIEITTTGEWIKNSSCSGMVLFVIQEGCYPLIDEDFTSLYSPWLNAESVRHGKISYMCKSGKDSGSLISKFYWAVNCRASIKLNLNGIFPQSTTH